MPRDRGEADRCKSLTDEEIGGEQSPERRALDPSDERPRMLLQPIGFEQADDGKDDPDDRDIAGVVERLAEGGDDRGDVESRGEPGRERRGHDHEQGIEAEQEARDDDEDADQDEHQPRACDVGDLEGSRGDAEARRSSAGREAAFSFDVVPKLVVKGIWGPTAPAANLVSLRLCANKISANSAPVREPDSPRLRVSA